uniref:Reverse transcriptase domain-containing protein n=1 Tax=Cannabis sativa TaxID=3483 RepID=A0A803QN19_CANSA
MASSSADGRNMMPVNEQLYLEEEEVEALRVPVAREEEPGMGMYVKELNPNLFLFQFYHEIDIQRVIEGSPWTYDRKPFIFTRLKEGDNPRLVGINHLDMWIQLHDLQSGNQTLSVVTALGNYIGQFLESDQNNFVGVWREYLRVRVRIDVRKPIKRRRKIITEHSSWYWVNFKYEKLPTFCFICGIIGHAERFCPRLFEKPLHLHDKPYGLELRAPNQRRQSSFGAQWLRSGAVVREDGRRPSHDSSASPGSNPRPTNVEEIVGQTRQNHGINNPHFHGIIDSRNPSDGILGINGEDAALNVSNNGNFFDSDITTIVDSKRKRPGYTFVDGMGLQGRTLDDKMEEIEIDNTGLSKNGPLVRIQDGMERLKTQLGFEGCFVVDSRGHSGGLALLWKFEQEVEIQGFSFHHIDALIHLHGEVLSECELIDMPLQGYPFTWEKGRNSDNWIEERLDKALVNNGWLNLFSQASLFNLEVSIFDHCPLLLVFQGTVPLTTFSSFRFENAWLRELMCKVLVESCWVGSGNCTIQEKIRSCGEVLGKWGKDIRRDTFLKQRSKQFWLNSGDKNSKYFHSVASSRKRNNRITQLQDQGGRWVNWESGLQDVIKGYFQDLFHSSGFELGTTLNGIQPTVTDEQNESLLIPVEEDEVRRALFQMHPNKSPGPDGMNPAFYQKHWDIVGSDVVHFVQDFFESGKFPNSINDTHIALIPKKKNPSQMSDLRPISLCNVLYKIASKVLANRMKGVLNEAISETQSAFVSGRLISDNVMVAFEVMHYLKRKTTGRKGYMAIKLDMSKAYDRVEWGFLGTVLCVMGFSERWIALTMSCVNSVRYHVLNSGQKVGPIIPSRGIRQGCPLSPYLFIVCAEGLSSLIRQFEVSRRIIGCKVARSAPIISHLLFADDSYVYCQATEDEAAQLMILLQIFEGASGQRVNIQKSSVFFSSNTHGNTRTGICDLMNINEAGADGTCKEIERLMANFWWKTSSSNGEGSGIIWMSWDRMTKHKLEGGMGFRSLRDFNLAMLGKQGWRLLVKHDTLASKIFKARYYPQGNYLTAELGSNPSFIWSSIYATKFVVKMGLRKRIGSGSTVRITEDPWLPIVNRPTSVPVTPGLENFNVSSLFQVDSVDWDVDVVRDLFSPTDAAAILGIPISQSTYEDTWYWLTEQDGFYYVRSAYKLIQDQKFGSTPTEIGKFWKQMWAEKVPPKSKDFIWRAASKCLSTKTNLCIKKVLTEDTCPFCNVYAETELHVLVQCTFAWSCWEFFGLAMAGREAPSLLDWLERTLQLCNGDAGSRVLVLCWALCERAIAGCKIGRVSPELAEVMGIQEALSWIKTNNYSQVVIEADSRVCVEAI